MVIKDVEGVPCSNLQYYGDRHIFDKSSENAIICVVLLRWKILTICEKVKYL